VRVLVTGATGRVGRAVLNGLLAVDIPCRGSSRDPRNAELSDRVEIVGGDLNEPESMARALEGVSAVFLYAQGKSLSALMQVMKRAAVEQVVFLSTIDAANERDYVRHNRRRHLDVEEAISAAGFRFTFLRPGAFATNALRFWRSSIAGEGVVRIPFPDAQQAPIDELDIAAVAVRALLSRALDSQALVLTGPESLTQRQQVETIANAIGRPIQVETTSEDQARAWLESIIPAAYAKLLVSQWKDEVGTPACVTGNFERVIGKPATPYATWVARNAHAFRTP
jgi:uncharacterized protein YbjT (DUF2867 family)